MIESIQNLSQQQTKQWWHPTVHGLHSWKIFEFAWWSIITWIYYRIRWRVLDSRTQFFPNTLYFPFVCLIWATVHSLSSCFTRWKSGTLKTQKEQNMEINQWHTKLEWICAQPNSECLPWLYLISTLWINLKHRQSNNYACCIRKSLRDQIITSPAAEQQ